MIALQKVTAPISWPFHEIWVSQSLTLKQTTLLLQLNLCVQRNGHLLISTLKFFCTKLHTEAKQHLLEAKYESEKSVPLHIILFTQLNKTKQKNKPDIENKEMKNKTISYCMEKFSLIPAYGSTAQKDFPQKHNSVDLHPGKAFCPVPGAWMTAF